MPIEHFEVNIRLKQILELQRFRKQGEYLNCGNCKRQGSVYASLVPRVTLQDKTMQISTTVNNHQSINNHRKRKGTSWREDELAEK